MPQCKGFDTLSLFFLWESASVIAYNELRTDIHSFPAADLPVLARLDRHQVLEFAKCRSFEEAAVWPDLDSPSWG